MTYFNGGIHGWNGPNGYIPAEPTTRVLCDDCAEKEVPFKGPKGDGRRHHGTGFKWCPYFGGNQKCDGCKKPV